MRLRIADQDLADTDRPQHLQDQQADRSAAEQRDALEQAWLRQVDGVDGDAERLQHDRIARGEMLRHRDDLRRRHPDPFGHRAIIRRRADEDDLGTKIGMSRAAVLAMTAGLIGIDSDERAASQAERGQILSQPAAELMPRHEGRRDHRRADAAILVIVQVAAAKPDGGDVDQRFTGRSLSQIEGRDARIAGGMQEHGMGHFGTALRRNRHSD